MRSNDITVPRAFLAPIGPLNAVTSYFTLTAHHPSLLQWGSMAPYADFIRSSNFLVYIFKFENS